MGYIFGTYGFFITMKDATQSERLLRIATDRIGVVVEAAAGPRSS